jgi:hypothetical protein
MNYEVLKNIVIIIATVIITVVSVGPLARIQRLDVADRVAGCMEQSHGTNAKYFCFYMVTGESWSDYNLSKDE